MNRLIDANKLMAKMKKAEAEPAYQHIGEEWYVGMVSAEGLVDEAETVTAIPEEWINDHVAWLESMDADVAGSDARAIKVMLTKWKMEQENAGGCTADACPIKF